MYIGEGIEIQTAITSISVGLKFTMHVVQSFIRQYKLIDLDYGFTYPKFLDLEKTFIF